MALKRKNRENEAPKENSLWERIKKKSRVTISDLDSYEVKRFILLSPLQLIIGTLFTLMVFITATWFLIAYTPLRQSIPGYPKINEVDKIKRQDIENLKKLDSLYTKLESVEQYNKNLITLLNEELVVSANTNELDSTMLLDSSKITKLTLEKSPEDSILRVKYFASQKYGVHYENTANKAQSDVMAGIFFFPPLKGKVMSEVNFKKGEYGVAIGATKDEAVKATLDGTIIFSEWSPEFGYLVYVQHAYNLVSVYKYNSVLLKKTGDLVKAGEPIAIIGSSGAKSDQGNQLYFELWYNGLPLDPLKFLSF